MKHFYIKILFAGTALALAACSPKVDSRGYVKTVEWKDAITVGQTTREDVMEKFGSPSAKSSFGDETWYYVSSRKEAVAFLKPEVVEQEAVDISFDASGVVSAVNIHNQDDAKDVKLVKRETPTEGHSLNFIEQALGNLGRFNKPGGGDTVAPGRRPNSGGGF